jgi:hypothetical protein
VAERLTEDPGAVSALAGRVAEQTGLPLPHVEKDFWVTEVLRGVAAGAREQGVEVILKGGTSLSKVFSMIRRFSEDVDMLVLLPPDRKGPNDRTLKALVAGAGATTGLDAEIDAGTTTKGVKRSARFHYPSPHPLGGGLSRGVLLELGTRGGPVGSARVEVRSIIADNASDIGGFPEAEPVPVRVMAPWRTLVEKLVLLHTAHCDEAPEPAVKAARHFYDVHQLLGHPLSTATPPTCRSRARCRTQAGPRASHVDVHVLLSQPRARFVTTPARHSGDISAPGTTSPRERRPGCPRRPLTGAPHPVEG